MEYDTPKFTGFPEPAAKTNFTPVPNLLFDEVLKDLKEAELKVLLYIFRRTYGWQKDVDCIAVSQFVSGIVGKGGRRIDYGTGLAKSTVINALKSVVRKGYVLRYIANSGSQRRSYFFLNTARNRQVVQALDCGEMKIEQVLALNRNASLGPKSRPKFGSNSEPNSQDMLGSKSIPTERSTKERRQKKAHPADESLPKSSPQDDEHLREYRINQQRRREGSAGKVVRLGDILRNQEIPVQE